MRSCCPDFEELALRTVAFVPARGGSKGLAGKNLAKIAGASLVRRAVEVAYAAGLDEVVVSSDDDDILAEARGCGALAVRRDPSLAADDTPTIEVLQDFVVRRPEVEVLVLLQPTSPLRAPQDVRACLDALDGADRVVTVTRNEHPVVWSFRVTTDDRLDPVLGWDAVATRRQDISPTYRLNGAVYALRTEAIRRGDPLVGPGTAVVVMPPERSVDIDGEIDLELARTLAARAASVQDQ